MSATRMRRVEMARIRELPYSTMCYVVHLCVYELNLRVLLLQNSYILRCL